MHNPTPLFIRNKTFLALLCVISLCNTGCFDKRISLPVPSSISISNIPSISNSFCQTVLDYENFNFATFSGWLPSDKGIIAVSRDSDINQLFYIEKPHAKPRKLTSLPEPITEASMCPDPKKRLVAFTQDKGGNENFQIYLLHLDSFRTEQITVGNFQNSDVVWSNSGNRFAFQSNSRNGKDFDVCICDLENRNKIRTVISQEGSWSILDWSQNDSCIIVSHYLSRTASFLYVYTIASGTLTPLFNESDTVSQECAVFGPGNSGIFLTSDKNTDVRTLRYVNIQTHHDSILTPNLGWDVREIAIAKNRKILVFQTNENGFSHLYIMNTATFAFKEITGLPKGGIYGLHFDYTGEYIGVTVVTPQHPEEAFTIRLSDFALEQWTFCGPSNAKTIRYISPELIHYPTFDSMNNVPRTIPCFIYKPRNIGKYFPVLISLHGGPESQFWPYFNPQIQYYVNELGICVVAPNVRGSGGYGKKWLSLDNGFLREDAIKDVGCLLDWIKTQKDLDTNHVGVFGGSYGGFLSLASMETYTSRFVAGIDMYGISNFITFLDHTAGYRKDLRRVEYGDERVPAMHDFLVRISPLSHTSQIKAPLFIIQGANDPRVPLGESQQIANAALSNHIPVWTLVAKDEGHGFRKKSNNDYQECAQAMFLKTYLVK